MRGKFLPIVFLLGLHFFIHEVAGAQLDPILPRGECRCQNTTMNTVEKNKIKKIEFIPLRPYCQKIEIVVITKTGESVCIYPETKLYKYLIHYLIKMKELNQRKQKTQ
ncbi:alveolar macrophage chemotactic factor-like [Engystomops pustulosus]|uniref:alveolar macrophage chemotactic factor-like n=1 Tax=Engystomops pustulosus TaxID=76066 RepID=UPI003AFA2423